MEERPDDGSVRHPLPPPAARGKASGPVGHCLYVAWGFPPARGGGAYRMMTTANLLVEHGWEVTVLACAVEDLRRYTGVDASLERHVDDCVRVRRVPFDLGPAETDLRRYSRLRALYPGLWDRWQRLRRRRAWPENVYSSWQRPLERAAGDVHRSYPVDLTLVSAGPFVGFTAARFLSRRHHVPYVVDHRDAWSLQQFTGERTHAEDSRAGRAERATLAGAVEVWFVNDPIREWYESAFPEIRGRTRVVRNGFDPDVVHDVRPPRDRREHDCVRFGFLGTMTISVPLDEFLAGWRRFRERDVDGCATTEFVGYMGYYRSPTWKLLNAVEKAAPDGVRYAGPVPKAEVGEIYSQLDALLLIFGGDRYVTSGKVFEYMATGRPIVSVHGPGNAVREVLEGYPLWFPAASLEPDDIADALASAADAVRSGKAVDRATWEAALAHAETYRRSAQIGPAVADLATRIGIDG